MLRLGTCLPKDSNYGKCLAPGLCGPRGVCTRCQTAATKCMSNRFARKRTQNKDGAAPALIAARAHLFSHIGRALESLGRTEELLNEHQLKFVNNVKEGWLPELQRSLDDFREYVALQKQLNARRSDYDSKMVKFQKARKDNITAEDDLRTAQVRYEDTYEDLGRRMLVMQDAEQEYLRGA
ncbi:hypothetical protein H4R21_006507, partial [Coemansia helicoidea]